MDIETLSPLDVISRTRLDEILAFAPQLSIAVLGDFFLDRYLITDPALAERSLETGLEARQVVETRCSPGAAGTVTNNLAALGVGRIEAVGVIGDDGEALELVRGLVAGGVTTDYLLRARERFTPTYMKPMVREPAGERELERLDIKNRSTLPAEVEARVIRALRALAERRRPTLSAVIIADQVDERDCGVVTERVRNAVTELAADWPNLVFLADSRARIGEFRNVVVKPNRAEAARALGHPTPDSLEAAAADGTALAARTGRPVFLTVGEEGIIVCATDRTVRVSAVPVDGPIDIVGAGDSATAGVVTALCGGANVQEAAALGCLCANVTVRKLGTTGTASHAELRALLDR